MKKTILSLLALGTIASSTFACGDYGFDLEAILNSDDKTIATHAADFRAKGELGLSQLLAASRSEKQHPNYASMVDQVAKQKDALKSKLFWHTNFDEALAIAKATKLPIISLRLLGNLDDEYSCANSRLFREVLYPDPAVSKFLRENFVLHWKSVRPVPVMTIDFGDGRILKRTITGNSAHYILDSQGRVVDALPGLYTAEKFLAHLQRGHDFIHAHSNSDNRNWANSLKNFHERNLAILKSEFKNKLKASDLEAVSINLSNPIEMSDLNATQWAKFVAAKPAQPQLQRAAIANNLTTGKSFMEAPLIKEVATAERAVKRRANLEASTAEDNARNEFVFHRRVHERLAVNTSNTNLAELNKWVYAELFEMPDSDPWLGLHTPDVFTGLKNNGVIKR